MTNEVLYASIIIQMCFIWYLTYIHLFIINLMYTLRAHTNLAQSLLYILQYAVKCIKLYSHFFSAVAKLKLHNQRCINFCCQICQREFASIYFMIRLIWMCDMLYIGANGVMGKLLEDYYFYLHSRACGLSGCE